MIADLAENEVAWLRSYFSSPNELTWPDLERRAAPQPIVDHILPWLRLLQSESSRSPILLPFVRAGEIRGWYATTRNPRGASELKLELTAWLGPSYLGHFREVPSNAADPMAAAMRERFTGTVFRLAPSNPADTAKIAKLVTTYASLCLRRPQESTAHMRPIGTIRAEFERALLVQDSNRAEELVAELRGTGRLNEENLKYLGVRLKAGLGLWPQIARDHWLVRTLADLQMPGQILTDIVEALFRTYVEVVESGADTKAVLAAFEQSIAKPYPRLFSSRRGIKNLRVVKAFLLFECTQAQPNPQVLAELSSLLSQSDPTFPLYAELGAGHRLRAATEAAATPAPSAHPQSLPSDESLAEQAFSDEQYDRAFTQFLALPLSKRSGQCLVNCVLFIDTREAKQRLLDKIGAADQSLVADLSERTRAKIDEIRRQSESGAQSANTPSEQIDGWMRWAEALKNRNAESATSASEHMLTWETSELSKDKALSQRFANLVGSLSGDAETVARGAVPAIYNAFFPDGQSITSGTKPIAVLLFDLIALDDKLSSTDLELLLLLLVQLLAAGLASTDYSGLLNTLDDVQDRVSSYMHLAWSLDVCEALAVAPAPSHEAREARREFFRKVINQTQAFAHRLQRQDVLPLTFLCHDFEVDAEALGSIKLPDVDAIDSEVPNLSGKLIGIYTLAEAAGNRAKAALEAMFPGVRVGLNSDTVATPRLTSLAKVADLFVFAWKSSSHQAFFCVKEAMGDRDPVMAAGKGTSSILRAVMAELR